VPLTRAQVPPVDRLTLEAPTGEVVRAITSVGGSLWIRATGDSMRPTIHAGTRVRLVPIPGRALRKGEVVLATLLDGRTVLHRIRAVRNAHVVLRGDACVMDDAPAPFENVIALADVTWAGNRSREVPRRDRALISVRLRRIVWTLRRTLALLRS
jgi:Peptidase S24-like